MTSGFHERDQALEQTQRKQQIRRWVSPVESLGLGPTWTQLHILFLSLDQRYKLAGPASFSCNGGMLHAGVVRGRPAGVACVAQCLVLRRCFLSGGGPLSRTLPSRSPGVHVRLLAVSPHPCRWYQGVGAGAAQPQAGALPQGYPCHSSPRPTAGHASWRVPARGVALSPAPEDANGH